MPDMSVEIVIFLTGAAFAAGFIDSIAGGGGLITVPALLLSGFSPVHALGTNKVQSLFGSGSATIAYAGKGHVDLKSQVGPAMLSFAGAAAGAFIATLLSGDILKAALPPLLISIALYFTFKPGIGDIDRARRLAPFLFSATVVPAIGFYDGVFGPGTGSFFMLSFVTLAGYGILKATAHTKLLNFASNCGGFTAFALSGVVAWKIGVLMGAAQFAGARLGASLAMRKGARIVKPLLIATCLLLAIRLMMDPSNPVRQWLSS